MTDTFWDWAVARYQRNGVAAACLALQDDHGQNVPLLLWAAWAAAHGMRIEPRLAEAVRLARAWSDAVIVPLRGVRRRLKTPLSEGDEVARLKLRERVKAVELEAERALMAQLEALVAPGEALPAAALAAAIGEALAAAAGAWAAEIPADGLDALTRALTTGEFLGYNG